MNSLLRFFKRSLLALPLIVVTAAAQNTFYVDPVVGSNATGTGALTNPFKTLNFTYANIAFQGDVIVLLPGTYSPATNGDTWPLRITNKEVVIQGTSALNTILDAQNQVNGIIWLDPSPTAGDLRNVLIDSVTLTNGYYGILCRSEFGPVASTVANCFINNNIIGAWMDGPANPALPHQLKLVNDTIASNSIGILDYGGPPQPPAGNPRGYSDPAIINCLVYPNTMSDLQGVDNTDILNLAFATFDQAPFPWNSRILLTRPNPVPTVNLANVNVNQLYVYTQDTNATPNLNDYRQIPGRPGFPQAPTVDSGTWQLTVPNGTQANQIHFQNANIWDADCEGFGNFYPTPGGGNNIDIGADQLGQLIVFGYAPRTTRFTTGGVLRKILVWLVPNPSLPGVLYATFHATQTDSSVHWAADPTGYFPWGAPFAGSPNVPGVRSLTSLSPGLPIPPLGFCWLNLIPLFVPPGFPVLNFPMPSGPLTIFGYPMPNNGQILRNNWQALPVDSLGNFSPATNLQTFDYTY